MSARGRNIRGRGGRSAPRTAPPVSMLRNQVLSGQQNAVKRLMRDYKELQCSDTPCVGVTAEPLNDNYFCWHANIRGPADTVYKGAVIHCELTFPTNYPVAPPKIAVFMGSNILSRVHKNVFGNTICLDMLQRKPAGANWYEGWTSCYTVQSILMQLQSFLFEKPKKQKKIKKSAQTSDDDGENVFEDIFQEIVNSANSFKCSKCNHKGPLEPFPAFKDTEVTDNDFIFVRDQKQMLHDELVCFHTRENIQDHTMGIGVSLSRLPRTGEIRSVTPSLDLLSMKAFTKHKVRHAIDGEKFTHWLPLYFGEKSTVEKVDKKLVDNQEVVTKRQINQRERMIHLLRKSISWITKKDTRQPLTAEMAVEVLPKLITTHCVEMCSENKYMSVVAIRRLLNFIRLFRLLIELEPRTTEIVHERLKVFMEQPEKRVKDHCSNLGDILSFATISDKVQLDSVLDAYLEEQLDRQVFWILRSIPEFDFTDEKYKNKNLVIEENRNIVCFKTGLVGFRITMIFHSLNRLINAHFAKGGNKDMQALVDSLDSNHGCLDDKLETAFQAEIKALKKVDNFNKYYQWVGRQCPDQDSLAVRLRKAIQSSKDKRYHGSSEHMNVLPTMSEQASSHLLREPSPFVDFGKVSDNDEKWAQACYKKFPWTATAMLDSVANHGPASLALRADKYALRRDNSEFWRDSLKDKHADVFTEDWQTRKVSEAYAIGDYPSNFSWRHLFAKLCFEEMIENLPVTCDFKMMYDYINKLGPLIPVLRIPIVDKTKLKSNHYWIMALVGKMPNLETLKIHRPHSGKTLGPDGWKFLQKGFSYMKQNGRSLKKLCFNNILANECGEMMYPCLKSLEDLQSIVFNDVALRSEETKAIGKVLAAFKQVRELDLSRTNLTTSTVKDIADGLMRAKQMEIVKLAGNVSMSSSINSIIYNLAFSPKIRYLDLTGTLSTNSETVESLTKLLNISGSIEHLNLSQSACLNQLNIEFFKAVGQNKTLKTLNLAAGHVLINSGIAAQFGQAIAWNKYKGGSLESVDLMGWFNGSNPFQQFLMYMMLSDHDHEVVFGDKNEASKMEKGQLEKHFYFGLKYLNIGEKGVSAKKSSIQYIGNGFKPKEIVKREKPDWPLVLRMAAASSGFTFELEQASLQAKDMEIFNYMLGENPIGPSKITKLNLRKNPLTKDGIKLFAPCLSVNKSLVSLDLSMVKMLGTGMKYLSDSLKSNSTLQHLNLYRNILDVDGARHLAALLKVNCSIQFLDVGHNRIRKTGLRAIVEAVKANPKSKLSQLGIRANFISDAAFEHLFDNLVLTAKPQLTQLFIKHNFQSEMQKTTLAAKLPAGVYVDAFTGVDFMKSERLSRSVWISPVVASLGDYELKQQLFQKECGFVVDIRMKKGRKIPGRPTDNYYATVEFADVNSVNRCLNLASKQQSKFNNQRCRIYRSGTQTAILLPRQKRA